MTSSAPRLAIASIPDLIAVIPRLLRFHPSESLVLVVVADGTLQLTARIDLAQVPDAASIREHLGGVIGRFPDALYLAVAFTPDAHAAWSVLAGVLDAACGLFEVHCFHVDGQRWFDAPDAPGEPYDISANALAAEATFLGLPARASRAELEASVDPTVTPRQVTRALRAFRRRNWDQKTLTQRAIALVEAAEGADADAPDAALPLVDALTLTLASYAPSFREEAIWTISQATAWRHIDLWTQVVRGTPPSCAGNPLLILGVAAWVAGDGALQVVCLNRARLTCTDEAWVDFLEWTHREVIPPTLWTELRVVRELPPVRSWAPRQAS